MKTLVLFALLSFNGGSDVFNTEAKAPSQWCVKMKCSTDGFGQCTMVEVEANDQYEARKKAVAKYPDCNFMSAYEKMNQKCTCN